MFLNMPTRTRSGGTNCKQEITMKSGSTEWCAMNMAEDNFAHNIPHEWITEKVWAVLLKNPVYKDYVKKYSSFVNKKFHSNPLTKPKNVSIIGISNETTNSNKKETNTMKKNTNKLITELDNTMLTSNVAQLTDAVNKILARLDALEAKNVAPKHEFKKLRETAEEVKKETKKVAPKKKVINKANNEQKAEIVKLQKRAQKAKKSLTKKQLAQYTRMWHAKWQEINKTIDINDKAARSLAFAKGRISCLKKARTY